MSKFERRVLSSLLMIISMMMVGQAASAQAQDSSALTANGTDLASAQKLYSEEMFEKKIQSEKETLNADERRATNAGLNRDAANTAAESLYKANEPKNVAPAARAAGQAQATAAGNAAGDVARNEAIAAIDYASRFLVNFTTQGGNKWNKIRDNIFVPMALLLLLPGAVATQVKAVISAGSPAVAPTNPFEGIQRSMIALFLIPGSYLVVNYGIDFANSVQFTISSEYRRMFGTDMYKDAICAEIRAFSTRGGDENEGSMKVPPADLSPIGKGAFSKMEGMLWGKLVDPCVGLLLVPANRDDAAMPAASIAGRLLMNSTNAGITTCWSILCAFQMAFMYYLFFVGPLMAALWVWPVKQLRDAFPAWVEGVITLCCWSLFWHTTIMLIACFKGTDDTGLLIITALNFLATACVKHAFDFSGLVKAAGQKAAEMIEKAGKEAGKGGEGGGGGGGGGGCGAGAKGGESGGESGGEEGGGNGGGATPAYVPGGSPTDNEAPVAPAENMAFVEPEGSDDAADSSPETAAESARQRNDREAAMNAALANKPPLGKDLHNKVIPVGNGNIARVDGEGRQHLEVGYRLNEDGSLQNYNKATGQWATDFNYNANTRGVETHDGVAIAADQLSTLTAAPFTGTCSIDNPGAAATFGAAAVPMMAAASNNPNAEAQRSQAARVEADLAARAQEAQVVNNTREAARIQTAMTEAQTRGYARTAVEGNADAMPPSATAVASAAPVVAQPIAAAPPMYSRDSIDVASAAPLNAPAPVASAMKLSSTMQDFEPAVVTPAQSYAREAAPLVSNSYASLPPVSQPALTPAPVEQAQTSNLVASSPVSFSAPQTAQQAYARSVVESIAPQYAEPVQHLAYSQAAAAPIQPAAQTPAPLMARTQVNAERVSNYTSAWQATEPTKEVVSNTEERTNANRVVNKLRDVAFLSGSSALLKPSQDFGQTAPTTAWLPENHTSQPLELSRSIAPMPARMPEGLDKNAEKDQVIISFENTIQNLTSSGASYEVVQSVVDNYRDYMRYTNSQAQAAKQTEANVPHAWTTMNV